ncbi:MAG: hypothetical protein WC224_04720 [Sphaerochaetaceae bacterium]
MVELNLFHYHDRHSFLNKTHPLAKILTLLLFSTLLIKATVLRTLLFFLFLILVAIATSFPLHHYFRELRFFIVMALIIGLARYLGSSQGSDFFISALNFASIVLMGLLFSDSTAPDELSGAFPWWGSSLSLTLATIPLVLDTANQLTLARKARGEGVWSNPFKRIASYTTALLDLLLEKSANLEEALIARFYDQRQRPPFLKFSYRDLILVLFSLIATGLFMLFT